MTIGSLRYWLFVTAGVISHPQGQTTIKLAVPAKERDWWRRLWEQIAVAVSQLQCSRESSADTVALRSEKITPKSTSYCMDTAKAKSPTSHMKAT